MNSRRNIFIILAVVVGVFFTCGCSTNPATGEQQLILYSREQEIAMGTEAAPSFIEQMGGPVENLKLQQYVQSIGSKLAAVSDRPMPYEFTLVRSETPNAFALPGGKIFISAGLMRQLQNERQLAAVLGHEVAHVAAQHNIQAMQRQMGAALFADVLGAVIGGSGGAAAEVGADIAGTMFNLQYSRGDESKADDIGIRYLFAAGYNPWSMVELLAVLSELSESQSSKFGNLFETHPLTSERIKDARKILADKYNQRSAAALDPNADRFNKMKKLLGSAD